MVVQEGERNAIDQRKIEYQLWEKHHIRVLRRTLADVAHRGKLSDHEHRLNMYDNDFFFFFVFYYDPNKHLRSDGHEVAVAYFRAAYTPKDFPTEKDWEARLLIERSLAIKCPTLAYQLVGCKKVQQVLAEPKQLEYFLHDLPDSIKRLRSCFAGLYSLVRFSRFPPE